MLSSPEIEYSSSSEDVTIKTEKRSYDDIFATLEAESRVEKKARVATGERNAQVHTNHTLL